MNTKTRDTVKIGFEERRAERARENALMDTGKALRKWRETVVKLTQEQLATVLGVGRSTIQSMESGDEGVAIGTWMRAWQRMSRLHLTVEAVTPQNEIDAAEAAIIAADVERSHLRRTGQ